MAAAKAHEMGSVHPSAGQTSWARISLRRFTESPGQFLGETAVAVIKSPDGRREGPVITILDRRAGCRNDETGWGAARFLVVCSAAFRRLSGSLGFLLPP